MLIHHDENGFKCSYPNELKKMENIQFFELQNQKTTEALFVLINNKGPYSSFNYIYETVYKLQTLLPPNESWGIIRFGDYLGFPGAKEILSKMDRPSINVIDYYWNILIPLGENPVEISIIEHNEDDLNNIWAPIVESMEFDIEKMVDWLNKPKLKSYNLPKTSLLKKDQSFTHTFYPGFGSLAFYDSAIKYNMPEIPDDEALIKKIDKGKKQATLYLPGDDIEVAVDFYLNEEPPLEDKQYDWFHIVEGIIGVDSGKLFVLDDVIEPSAEILMKKGNYKFQAYFGRLDNEDNSPRCRLYFWETKKKETNKIKVIKQAQIKKTTDQKQQPLFENLGLLANRAIIQTNFIMLMPI